MASHINSGGFILPSVIPSPPPSTSSYIGSPLPTPRSTALVPGSSKESALVNFIDGRLREISARFERRFKNESDAPASEAASTESPGYKNFFEIAADLDRVVEIIWISSTPSLQIPFLLNIANSITEYMVPFTFAPNPTLHLLQKLDYAFSSLLHGHDFDSGDPLPGLAGAKRITMTEKVRLRGLVERTRLQLVNLAGTHDRAEESDTGIEYTTDSEQSEIEDISQRDADVELDTAKIYQGTLAYLGDSL